MSLTLVCASIDLIIMISNGIYIHEIHLGLQMSPPVSPKAGEALYLNNALEENIFTWWYLLMMIMIIMITMMIDNHDNHDQGWEALYLNNSLDENIFTWWYSLMLIMIIMIILITMMIDNHDNHEDRWGSPLFE